MHNIAHIRSRFTVYGSRLLDERIKRDLKYLVNYLLEQPQLATLVAIWLGGSYGRSEGAVYRQEDQEQPWFDYNIYLIYKQLDSVKSQKKYYQQWEAELSKSLGISVQFETPGDTEDLKNTPHTLRWYELFSNYQVIWGDADIIPPLIKLPIETPLKLLLYWGGHILQSQVLPRPIESNIFYRTIMAMGDAWLIRLGRYHSLKQERAQRFHACQQEHGYAWLRELSFLYQESLQYQLVPSEFNSIQMTLERRTPTLIRLFTLTYLGIFSQIDALVPDLNQFEQIFLNHPIQAPVQHAPLRHLVANLRLYHGRHFDRSWYGQPILHRLFFLLPFLLNDTLPEHSVLLKVLPDLDTEYSLQDVKSRFLKEWKRVSSDLI